MTTTTVVNLRGHRGDPDFDDVIYAGRAVTKGGWNLPASPLANPFQITKYSTREQQIERFHRYVENRPELLAEIAGLRGRRLGCWCAPEPCHVDVIAAIADASGAEPGPGPHPWSLGNLRQAAAGRPDTDREAE